MLTTPEEYAERFDQMLDALGAVKDRAVIEVRSAAPVDGIRYAGRVDATRHADLIAQVEAKLGLPLPPSVRAFYEFTPWMHFEWKDRRSGEIGGSMDMNIDYLVDSRQWSIGYDALEDWTLDAYGVNAPASEVLLPFDFFSFDPDFYSEYAAFLLPSFDVVVTEDSACGGSCLLTFEEYMDLMFRTFFSRHARVALSDYGDKGRAHHVFPELFERPFSLERESVLAIPPHDPADSRRLACYFRGRVNPFLGSNRPTERTMDSTCVRELAGAARTLSPDELRRIGDQHQSFLQAGGNWGTWTVFEAAGVPLCIYSKRDRKPGAQACFRLKNIAKADLRDAKLPFADLSAAYGVGADLSGADLVSSVLVDSVFEGASFTGARLRYADLSGCRLAGACFFGADLEGADFEGADCTDVDFRGANLRRTSFIGAKVSGAKTEAPPLELIEQAPLRLLPRVIATLRATQMGVAEIEAIAAREGVRQVLESHLRASQRVAAPEIDDNHDFYHLVAYLRACQRDGVGPEPGLTPKIAELADGHGPTSTDGLPRHPTAPAGAYFRHIADFVAARLGEPRPLALGEALEAGAGLYRGDVARSLGRKRSAEGVAPPVKSPGDSPSVAVAASAAPQEVDAALEELPLVVHLAETPQAPGDLHEVHAALWKELLRFLASYTSAAPSITELLEGADVHDDDAVDVDARTLTYRLDHGDPRAAAAYAWLRIGFAAGLSGIDSVVSEHGWWVERPRRGLVEVFDEAALEDDHILTQMMGPSDGFLRVLSSSLAESSPAHVTSAAWYLGNTVRPPVSVLDLMVRAAERDPGDGVFEAVLDAVERLAERVDLYELFESRLAGRDAIGYALAATAAATFVARGHLTEGALLSALCEGLHLPEPASSTCARLLGERRPGTLASVQLIHDALVAALAGAPPEETRHNAVLSLINLHLHRPVIPPGLIEVFETHAHAGSPVDDLAKWAIAVLSPRDTVPWEAMESPVRPDTRPVLDDYLDRFKRMVAELAAHPRVRVTHCWYGAPVTDAEVARVEAALGYALAPEIVSFYRQANGLQLRWLDTGNESYVAGRDDVTKTERAHYLCGDNDEANGVIDLLPLAECLVDNDYDGHLYGDDWGVECTEFAGKTYPGDSFGRGLRLIDRFSFWSSAALFVGDRVANPPVILGDDHDACWTDSRITDFRSYLELVLTHRGDVRARYTLHEGSGHERPAVSIAAAAPAPLDATLPAVMDYAAGVRVVLPPAEGLRGTVVARVTAPTQPQSWKLNRDFLMVRTDLGETVLVHGRPPHVDADAYERAWGDPEAFAAQLLAASPGARTAALSAIAEGSHINASQSLMPTPGGSVDGLSLILNHHGVIFASLTSRLPAERAVTLWVRLLDGLIPWNHVAGMASTLVTAIASALVLELMRTYAEAPYEGVRSRFGDLVALQLTAVATRLAEDRSASSMGAFLRLAVEKLPATIAPPSLGGCSGGTAFGLDNWRVVTGCP